MGKNARWRSDRGATKLESAIFGGMLAVVLLGGAAFIAVEYFDVLDETHHATAQGGQPYTHSAEALAPVSVNVVAAATVVEPIAPGDPDVDVCADLPGTQPSPFDCSLPLHVDALDTSASGLAGRYRCPDRVSYEVVGGQEPSPDKQCILKTAVGY